MFSNAIVPRTLLQLMILSIPFYSCRQAEERPTNFIIIYCDDLGYGDIGAYGNTVHRTPNLDRMAREGVVFTDFYSASGLCTPSRSSLMTGCYAQRVDMDVNARPFGDPGRQVLFPRAAKGLNPDEVTIAELLKDNGYVTACVGKWHLGDQPPFLPTRHGFDHYYGIPYSNDMNRDFCPLPLMRGEEVIEAPVEQRTLTRRYTEEVLAFLEQNRDRPFFVYLPHTMPHNPIYASEDFEGQSANGIYGDAVEEIDWSTGRILDYLRANNLAEHTLVFFTSDNGASSRFGGSNGPLSGWKGSTMEGGMRVPGIFWWPGRLPPKRIENTIATMMDILPTFTAISGGALSPDRKIDGHNIYNLLTGVSDDSPYEYFYYFQLEQLMAIRKGPWKLHLALDSMYGTWYRGDIAPGRPAALFDLTTDIAEEKDILSEHPELVRTMEAQAEQVRLELGDLSIPGIGVRPAAIVENPVPLLLIE